MFNKYICILSFLLTLPVYSQFNGHRFSVSSSLVYTTSAEIFLNPNSFDPIARNRSVRVVDLINPSIELRYRVSEPLIVGVCVEYMRTEQNGLNLIALEGNNQLPLKTDDGFLLIPVETSLYYFMPFSTDKFKFLMGAGLGIYFGKFSRTFGDTNISTIESQTAFGIHVAVSMEYLILEKLGVKLEMKFRDPEFKNKNKYDKDVVNYEGNQILIMQDTFDTKVNVNGVTFLVGAAFYF
jgi:outer membrane protein W